MYVTTCGDSLFLKPKLQKMPEMVGYGAELLALQAAEGLSFSSRAARAEQPQAMDFLDREDAMSLLLSDGTLYRCDDFYEILEPDGEQRFRPESVLGQATGRFQRSY